MSNKYIIRSGLKYLNSIKIIDNTNLIFVPKWTRNKFNSFPFSTEFEAQLICEQIDEKGIKTEKIARDKFKKGNDHEFQITRRNFELILKESK